MAGFKFLPVSPTAPELIAPMTFEQNQEKLGSVQDVWQEPYKMKVCTSESQILIFFLFG